jgi:hypothetical protein
MGAVFAGCDAGVGEAQKETHTYAYHPSADFQSSRITGPGKMKKDPLVEFIEDHREPVIQEPVTQENLPEALKDGRITQQEVDRVWRETEYLSAQTPIEVRQMIVKIKEAGQDVTLIQQVMLQAVLDLRAAMFRDESKFAHLVAGTEAIVDKLQAINKWETLVENLSAKLDELSLKVDMLGRGGVMVDQEPEPDEWTGAKPIDFDLDLPTAYEPEPEEEYDRKIGSNWDAKNPRKK